MPLIMTAQPVARRHVSSTPALASTYSLNQLAGTSVLEISVCFGHSQFPLCPYTRGRGCTCTSGVTLLQSGHRRRQNPCYCQPRQYHQTEYEEKPPPSDRRYFFQNWFNHRWWWVWRILCCREFAGGMWEMRTSHDPETDYS